MHTSVLWATYIITLAIVVTIVSLSARTQVGLAWGLLLATIVALVVTFGVCMIVSPSWSTLYLNSGYSLLLVLAIVFVIIAAVFVAISYVSRRRNNKKLLAQQQQDNNEASPTEKKLEAKMTRDNVKLDNKESETCYTDRDGKKERLEEKSNNTTVNHSTNCSEFHGPKGKGMWESFRGSLR